MINNNASSFFVDLIDGVTVTFYLCITMNFSLRYFMSSNIIYRFSKNGRLVTEKEKLLYKVWVILLNIFTFIGGIGFAYASGKIVIKDGREKIQMKLYLGRLVYFWILEFAVIVILIIAVLRLA